MIKSHPEHTYELTDVEKSIIPLVYRGFQKHNGIEHMLTKTDICKKFNEHINKPGNRVKYGLNSKFSMIPERLGKFIQFFRTTDDPKFMLPIIGSSKGIYVSWESDDIKNQVISLRQRAKAINESADGMERFLKPMHPSNTKTYVQTKIDI